MMKFLLLLLLLSPSLLAFNLTEAVAAVIVREAGGEGQRGMQAVANVIANRANNKTPFEVVNRKWQFSCVNSITVTKSDTWENVIAKSKRHRKWFDALELAKKVENKNLLDITNGATHYYAPKKVKTNPSWAAKIEYKTTIGNHKFYRE